MAVGSGTAVAMVVMWLARLIAIFLFIATVLIAGYAPYTVDMPATLAIAGKLLLAAAVAWGIGLLVRRLAGAAH